MRQATHKPYRQRAARTVLLPSVTAQQVSQLRPGDHLVTADGWAWQVRSAPHLRHVHSRRLQVVTLRSDGAVVRVMHAANSKDVVSIWTDGQPPVMRPVRLK